MRIRITFAKTEAARYTSHLDLHRTWERTLRRAGLPLAYSQGYNPHPKINLASALPLGFTSEEEVVDVWLEQELPAAGVQEALRKAAPPGVEITRVETIDERAPTLQVELLATEYTITFLEPVQALDDRIRALLEAGSLPRTRRDKAYDLRPLVLELRRLPDDAAGRPRLYARLSAREGATGRPEEVVSTLDVDPLTTRVHRTKLIFRN